MISIVYLYPHTILGSKWSIMIKTSRIFWPLFCMDAAPHQWFSLPILDCRKGSEGKDGVLYGTGTPRRKARTEKSRRNSQWLFISAELWNYPENLLCISFPSHGYQKQQQQYKNLRWVSQPQERQPFAWSKCSSVSTALSVHTKLVIFYHAKAKQRMQYRLQPPFEK